MWESDDTVLAIAIEANTWTMLRMDTAGDLQKANDPVTGDPYSDVSFWFASMG